ncbi:unnamed protein product [Mytilus coruscus]|uniref:Uncharacterized protein n=1 Tax=Mytilus coruscus TaxID=42192 RepID=A0A6J8CR82_MYTCO|nr:unnamed protein product [Mytilus coruscus]
MNSGFFTNRSAVTDDSSHSEEKASTSLLEDNYSDYEAEDSETSRSGQESSGIRFLVMNDGEIDALMGIETTRGIKRQTRWGIDVNGIDYVEINDDNRQSSEVSPKMYATRDIYCPDASLMKYLTKRNKASEDIFQQPRCQKSMTDDNWYS